MNTSGNPAAGKDRPMLIDYHLHSIYSADSKAPLKEQLDAAAAAGLTHICFTDHVDYDNAGLPPSDLVARNAELSRLAPLYPSLDISYGMEFGMDGAETNRLAHLHARDVHLDFIIGSVHMVDGIDAYWPEYFEGRTREQAFGAYVSQIIKSIKVSDFSILGHYDFCTKYSPYSERTLKYSMFPEMFDDIFRFLIQSGRAMEVNTSAWQDDPAWGLDILTRFRELGGEFVTTGSDAHKPNRVGNRIGEAVELARAAGIRYIATYKKLKPIMHKI